MKTLMAIFMTVALMTGLGCQSTQASKQGGISPVNEQFSIVVPKSNRVRQGAETVVDISIKRGDYFKRDVKLEVTAAGIHVAPNTFWVKASDLPDVKLKISADMSAALGEYIVTVKGIPASGESTSVTFPVKVEAPVVVTSSVEAAK